MADLFDNPLGTDGFEFVEFTSPDPEALARHFERFGFTAVSRHRSKNVVRYKQGDINFLLNMDEQGPGRRVPQGARPVGERHGLPVKDAARRSSWPVERGAEPVTGPVGPMELNIPAIKGSAAPTSTSSTSTAPARSTTSTSARSTARTRRPTASA
jgi:4-hydroxyphenylpyruvate dioxygenase